MKQWRAPVPSSVGHSGWLCVLSQWLNLSEPSGSLSHKQNPSSQAAEKILELS